MNKSRICMLGDSHIGSILRAWRILSESFPDVACDFFPMPGATFRDVAIKDGIAVTSNRLLRKLWRHGGSTVAIDFSAYDAFVLVGYRTNSSSHTDLLRKFALYGFSRTLQTCPYISRNALQATIEDRIANGNAYRLANWIRQASTKPVFLSPTPKPTIFRFEEPSHNWVKKLIATEEWSAFDSLFGDAVCNVFVNFSVHVLDQPLETLEGSFSKMAYKRDGKGASSDVRPPPKIQASKKLVDYVHMNDEYGIAILKNHMPTIAAACQTHAVERAPA